MVGSKVEFEALNKFLSDKKVRLDPLVDRTYTLDQSREAYDYLNSGQHVGKIIVRT